jgi:hypothetical protein
VPEEADAMTPNTKTLSLRVSEAAAVQLGLSQEGNDTKTEIEWREEQRALKREGIERAKAATKAKRQAALDSDTNLREALNAHQEVVEKTSSKTRDRAEKQREIAMHKCAAAVAAVADLEQKLEAAKVCLQRAHEQAIEANTWYDHVVTQANARLDAARVTVQTAWLEHEAEWATHGKAFVRKHRDRSVRREAKLLLDLKTQR